MDFNNDESIESIKLDYLENLIKSHVLGQPIDRKYVFENGLEIKDLIIDSGEISALYNPKIKNEDSKKAPFEKLEEYKNPTSLKDINDLIRSGFGYVKLDSDIFSSKNDAEYFTYGIDIDHSMIIDGCGHRIYGDGLFRIFNITHSAIVENLTFINCGKHQRHGGAILNQGIAKIKNCKFLNGNARFGGAVSNFNILIVENSTFDNNRARSGGGAIHNEGSLNASACEFKNNTCGRYGGAINNERKLTIEDSIFKNNNAEIQGDSINNIGNIKHSNCRFDGNINLCP